MGVSVTHLHKLDSIQKMAERLCGTTFLSLASHCKASSIGLLCKLLDSQCQGPLQPVLISVMHAYSFSHLMDDYLLLQRLIKYNSLDLFIDNFLSIILSIWATIPLILRERERGITEGWSAICHLLQ